PDFQVTELSAGYRYTPPRLAWGAMVTLGRESPLAAVVGRALCPRRGVGLWLGGPDRAAARRAQRRHRPLPRPGACGAGAFGQSGGVAGALVEFVGAGCVGRGYGGPALPDGPLLRALSCCPPYVTYRPRV